MSAENIAIASKRVLTVYEEKKTASPARAWTGAARDYFVKRQDRWLGLLLPLALFGVWQTTTSLGWVKPLFLPSPAAVLGTLVDLLFRERFLYDVWVSTFSVFQGFLIGAASGLLVGVLAGVSKTTEKVLGATLDSIRQVPPLAWFPLIVLWVGAGSFAKMVVIGKSVFFPVFLNTLQGIRAVPKEYIEVGRVFEYSKRRLLSRVILPAALPSIFVGIRYGAGLAWAMIIAAEMLGGQYGLGYLLTRAQELLLTSQLFVVIVAIGVIGYGVDTLLRLTEKRLLRLRKTFEG